MTNIVKKKGATILRQLPLNECSIISQSLYAMSFHSGILPEQ